MHGKVPALVVTLLAVAALATGVPLRPAHAGAGGATGHRLLKAMWSQSLRSGASDLAYDRALGVNIYETRLRWDLVARGRPRSPRDPQDPAYAWPSDLSRAVAEAPRHGMQVAIQVFGAPSWANGGQGKNWAPLEASDLADFAFAAARRYPTVHLWMIWGEPTRRANFEPIQPARPGATLTPAQATAPRRYAGMLDAAYGALKQASPTNVVVGGMTFTAGDISTVQWIDNMRLPDGRPPRMDLYGHNPFSARVPDLRNPPSPVQEVDFSDLHRLWRLVNRVLGRPHRRRIQLFISEYTIPTARDREFNFHVSRRIQAHWIARAFQIARSTGFIYALGWIHLADDPPGGNSAGGLLDYRDHKKPGYFAFRDG